MIDLEKYKNTFFDYGFGLFRMISPSKSLYNRMLPYNTVFFDGNVCIENQGSLYKIWQGDIDITEEGDRLKEVADKLGMILYVFYKSDIMDEKDLTKLNINDSKWNTSLETPYVTEEYKEKVQAERLLNIKNGRINSLKRNRKHLLINKKLPIVEIIDNPVDIFDKKIDIPWDILDYEFENFKILFESHKEKPQREQGQLYNKYFKEHGYFSCYVFEKYLKEKFKIVDERIIDPCCIWLNRNSNHRIRKIDLAVEKMFNPNFTYGDFGRYVTCNYCIPSLSFLNADGINIKSYKDDVFYIRRGDISKEKSRWE